jgi:hypothetical protein
MQQRCNRRPFKLTALGAGRPKTAEPHKTSVTPLQEPIQEVLRTREISTVQEMVPRARFAADAVASASRASLARERASGRRRTSCARPPAPLAAR